jgi:uncharacterized protein YcfJ
MSATKNPDKITKVNVEANPAQSHPVGTAVGAAGGAGAGALGGAAVGGPVGAAVGAAVGAVVGAVSGHAAAEAFDPSVETNYWRLNYKTRPYYKEGRTFGDYEAAYRYGWENAIAKKGMTFEEAEKAHLVKGWAVARGEIRHAWEDVRDASRDAWNRVRQDRKP